MTDFFSLQTLYQLGGYAAVSLGEFAGGWLIMSYFHGRRKLSWFWSYFFMSIVVGFVAFVVRQQVVFA